ncbi:hypothetical protein [Hymenobacter cheonanensis]|uniref:hypothetical protein n=1 Tax=Hymenobacter sp. CA2-7 TaxID=3063993 RepID=UPI002714446C|nr:hypothetical protein [Hymenobacter sp. CA2-7]MDO7884933.1 hypothetical protein [Hymenobacter sp. CA2-7]
MKHLLLLGSLCLLLARPAQASPRPAPAPADTVRGEARIAHLLTAGICAQVAIESRHQDLTVLTNSQGRALLQELLIGVVQQNLAEFEAFMAQSPGNSAALQRASIQAVLDLATACPVAGKLLTQMGAQMAGVDVSQLSAAQKQALQRVAHALCEQLAAENTARPLGQRTAQERLAAYHRAADSAPVATYYQAAFDAFSAELRRNPRQADVLWQQIDLLMFDECPAYTGPLRVDRGLQQLKADSARAAAPAPPEPAPRARAARSQPASRAHK